MLKGREIYAHTHTKKKKGKRVYCVKKKSFFKKNTAKKKKSGSEQGYAKLQTFTHAQNIQTYTQSQAVRFLLVEAHRRCRQSRDASIFCQTPH